jgi:hypothetical protein
VWDFARECEDLCTLFGGEVFRDRIDGFLRKVLKPVFVCQRIRWISQFAQCFEYFE